MNDSTHTSIIPALQSALGNRITTDTAMPESCCSDWSGHAPRKPLALARPTTPDEVSTILRLCHAQACPVVPQGGMTGLAGGAVPSTNSIALSLAGLDSEPQVDVAAGTLAVLAGTSLARVQQAAAGAGFRYPVDLPARDSCQIGGTIATNAGGVSVIRHGMTRKQVLGLEVILADGSVLNLMNTMKKNNAGYDLKHCFIGSEGTLGIITRAVLQLEPALGETQTLLCALEDYASVVALLRRVATAGVSIEAFEVMWNNFYATSCHWRGGTPPLSTKYPFYVLCDAETSADTILAIIEAAMDKGEVVDAIMADSLTQTQQLWAIREVTAEFATRMRPINFDISLPTATIGDFVHEVNGTIGNRWPQCNVLNFGHIGDSNLHLTVDDQTMPTDNGSRALAIESAVYELVGKWHGSISAEHGVGLLKRDFLHHSVTPQALATMATLKRALDPNNILNPGKVLPS